MLIRYATGHRWCKEVTDEVIDQFGKNDAARLRSTLKKVTASGVRHVIEPLSDSFLDRFLPLYEKRILEKENPTVFDIRTKTLGNPDKAKRYHSLSLYEGERFLGGLIFSIKEDVLSIAYRTLANKWEAANLQARPSLYVEYLISDHARAIGSKTIIHGKDRNPYGLNSSIGLANFKLSSGCRPQLPKIYEIATIETADLERDALILEFPEVGEKHADIKKAYLVADAAGIEKWKALFKHHDRLHVEVIERKGGV